MNWPYLGLAALLPLTVALGLTLVAGAFQALRLNREGGSSRAALGRLLRTLALVFPLAFLAATLWNGRRTWRGLAGVAAGRPADQRVMGLLRAGGRHFLRQDAAKAAHWYRKAAEGGDAEAQLLLAGALSRGEGLSPNPAEALRWAEAAGNQGLAEAMAYAGDLRLPVDPAGAEAWYRRAVEAFRIRIGQRDAEACLAYGLLLTRGRGADRDPVEGLAHMYLARALGLDPFKVILIQMSEAPLSKPQRAEAAARAKALRADLPKGEG